MLVMCRRCCSNFRFKVRWWKWFLSSPPLLEKYLQGPGRIDRDTAHIIDRRNFEAWLAREPKRCQLPVFPPHLRKENE